MNQEHKTIQHKLNLDSAESCKNQWNVHTPWVEIQEHKKKDQKRVGIIENEGGPCVPDPVVAERERGAKEDPGLGFSERERKKRL